MRTLYLPVPTKLNNIKNSDYDYTFLLSKLEAYSADLRTTLAQRSLEFDIRTYSRFALTNLRRGPLMVIPRSWCWILPQYYTLPTADIGLRSSDLILAYERYPRNARLPVLWITGPTDVETLRSRGLLESEIRQEIAFKREVNAQAAATVLTTQSKKELFDKLIQPTRPTHVIPFFQPIARISSEQFASKWSDACPIKLLFVGRDANRKGLPLVLGAYAALQKRYPGMVSLHVVSTLADGPVAIPQLPGLVYDPWAPHERVMKLMSEAHYLVMPSGEESYGWVFIEAMSQGVIPVAPNLPAQQELLDGGQGGWLVERTSSAIEEAVALGIEQFTSARELASRATDIWSTRYAPAIVAGQFAALAHASTNI